MNRKKIIKAWKNSEYRRKFEENEGVILPDNPVGAVELSDELLEYVGGNQEEMEAGTTVTIPITITLTTAASCWPSCNSTAWKGTCAVASVGCCGAE